MTKHRNTPLRDRPRPGESLLERASETFGAKGFAAAPVPNALRYGPKLRRAVRKLAADAAPATKVSAQPTQQPPKQPADQPVQQSADQPAMAAPATPEAAPIVFSGEIHAIDRDLLTRHGLIHPEGQVTGLLEEFRIVKRRVLSSMRKAREAGAGPEAQRILVSSPLPEEGKSYSAANLAIALAAEKDSEVLLVDADFAKPSLLSMFGLPAGPGLMDVLANPEIALEDCVLRTDIAGLSVLPAGHHTNSDSEFLASNRTELVLDMLTRGAPQRVVIFDSPPALAASPAAELANHVGQAIVIARADKTGQSALEDALTLLSACPDIKLLLNAAHFSPSGRRFGTYYGEEA